MLFELKDIAFAYADRPVFQGLSVNFEPSAFYGILGPNGCGKTTLLDLLCGLRRPEAGAISLNKRPLAAYGKRALSKQIALAPQDYHVNFPFTVEQVVMMGRYPHIPRFSAPAPNDRATVDQVLARTGLDAFRQRCITSLSGGERQRVVFARALAQDAEVLILDEATANMDIHHTLSLLGEVRALVDQKKLSAIAVFQDINLATSFCDRLVFMKSGRVAAAGETRSVLTPEILQEVFCVEAKIYHESFIQAPQAVVRRPGRKAGALS